MHGKKNLQYNLVNPVAQLTKSEIRKLKQNSSRNESESFNKLSDTYE